MFHFCIEFYLANISDENKNSIQEIVSLLNETIKEKVEIPDSITIMAQNASN